MSAQQRLILTGVAMMLVGTLYGAVHNFLVDHETLLVLKETYQSAFMSAAAGDMAAAEQALETAKAMNYRYVRAIDTHTHIIKLATLIVLIALVYPLLSWSEGIRRWLSRGFVAGAVMFPLGLFLQIYAQSILLRGLAAAGALLVIACFTLVVVGLFKANSQAADS